MGLLAAILCLCLVICGISADNNGRNFKMHKGKSPLSLPAAPVQVSVSSRPLSCHGACLRRADCAAFWLSGTTCSLYDTFADDPASQLQAQSGDVFFNLAVRRVNTMPSQFNNQNHGGANFFPQIRFKKGGRVLRWQVRCARAGEVMLAVWRGDMAVSATLIGKNRVTVPAGMENQLVTYDVPAEERVEVQAGDYVGFHYDVTEPKAYVKALDAPYTSDGTPVGMAHLGGLYDSDLPVGATVQITETIRRYPAIAVFTS